MFGRNGVNFAYKQNWLARIGHPYRARTVEKQSVVEGEAAAEKSFVGGWVSH